MPKFDSLGDRIKFYEQEFNGRYLMPLVPAIVRLDGRAFHSFTKGLTKPFDPNLMKIMDETTKFLVEKTNATIGYTQSDEINLILYSDDYKSQVYMDGKVDKINSLLAGSTTLYFNRILKEHSPEKALLSSIFNKLPQFDCRCFSVPTKEEAINTIIWREQDAVRNSIQAVGQANFSHQQLMGKNCNEIQEMLFQEKSINWNNFSPREKRGCYFQRRKVVRPFSIDEIENLPEKHEARKNPNLQVERHDVVCIEMPIVSKIINKEAVFFEGKEPAAIGGDCSVIQLV